MRHTPRGLAISVGLCVAVVPTLLLAACGQRRPEFDDDQSSFPDSSTESRQCLRQCSLDGRSVLDTCTGAIVQTCPPELACGAGTCQEPCAAAAADRSSTGCEFYFQPPLFTKKLGRSCYATFVVNTSLLPVDVSLEYQGKPLDVSKSLYRTNPGDATLIPHEGSLPPGESAILFVYDESADPTTTADDEGVRCPKGVIGATSVDGLPDGTGIGSSFHMQTNAPVSVVAMYPYGGSLSHLPSATLVFPTALWGKQHIIVNAWERTMVFTLRYGPAAHIVASEDDTEVTIRPTNAIQDGPGVAGTAAMVPATYRLGKGQVLQIAQMEELSGSVVTSNKPTSVFGGHECMYVPSKRSACDTASQQLPTFEQWGSEYVSVGYRPRLGNAYELMPYRIVAARDGTRLEYDPPVPPRGAPTTMSAGEVVTFWAGAGDAFTVRAQDSDHPVYLAAYMTGSGMSSTADEVGDRLFDLKGNGDPEFVNVVPAGQYLNSYSFFADPTYGETSLVIIRAKTGGQFEDVWLECAGNLTDFKPVGTRGEYEWTRVDLARGGKPGQAFDGGVCTNGLQRMRSDGPFTATLWGWDNFASYAYPAGMAQRKLVQTALDPIR